MTSSACWGRENLRLPAPVIEMRPHPQCRKPPGFDQVGRHAVPVEMDAGQLPVVLGGRLLSARMISDTSHHGLSEYFRDGPSGKARTLLFNFLQARLAIAAVQAHLKDVIYNNPTQLTLDDTPMDVDLNELGTLFHHAFFDRQPLLRLSHLSPGAKASPPKDAA